MLALSPSFAAPQGGLLELDVHDEKIPNHRPLVQVVGTEHLRRRSLGPMAPFGPKAASLASPKTVGRVIETENRLRTTFASSKVFGVTLAVMAAALAPARTLGVVLGIPRLFPALSRTGATNLYHMLIATRPVAGFHFSPPDVLFDVE
jgi:hypothetical protein